MKQNLKQTARKKLAAMALFLLICLPFSLAQAQTIKVNGKVTDDLNEPMIGVSIFEKGTTNGVITDMDGNYSLSVKEGATIVYSYIGYLTQEKKAVAGVMNVILKEDTKNVGRSGSRRLRCAEEKFTDRCRIFCKIRRYGSSYHYSC